VTVPNEDDLLTTGHVHAADSDGWQDIIYTPDQNNLTLNNSYHFLVRVVSAWDDGGGDLIDQRIAGIRVEYTMRDFLPA